MLATPQYVNSDSKNRCPLFRLHVHVCLHHLGARIHVHACVHPFRKTGGICTILDVQLMYHFDHDLITDPLQGHKNTSFFLLAFLYDGWYFVCSTRPNRFSYLHIPLHGQNNDRCEADRVYSHLWLISTGVYWLTTGISVSIISPVDERVHEENHGHGGRWVVHLKWFLGESTTYHMWSYIATTYSNTQFGT